jgi:cytochrome c oxidase assembly protein subunit 11
MARMNATGKTVTKLTLGAVAMFVFAIFVMPPLYQLFCEVVGVGIRESEVYTPASAEVDYSRTVRVRFDASNDATISWQFKPAVFEVEVHPGERTEIHYLAHNPTRKDMVAQAIPGVLPIGAFDYFHKTECFCFNQQPLAAGESAELPLVFIVDKDLPERIDVITLSYTLFDVTDRMVISQN